MKSPLQFLALLTLPLLGLAACDLQKRDPVAEMKKVAADLPRSNFYAGENRPISDVAYNVTKTQSLVNPIIGTIDFYNEIGYQMVFHWKNEKWVFESLLGKENGKDFTGWGGGLELMNGREMRPFLEKYGYTFSVPPLSAQSPARAASTTATTGQLQKPAPANAWMWDRHSALERSPVANQHDR